MYIQSISRSLVNSASGVILLAGLLTSMLVATQSHAEESKTFGIAHSGQLELTFSRPQGTEVASRCPLEVPVGVHLNAKLGAAERQISNGEFKASTVVLNGTLIDLDLHTDRFHFTQPVPLAYLGTVAEGLFVFTDDRRELNCPVQIRLTKANSSLPRQSEQASVNREGEGDSSSDLALSESPEALGPSIWKGKVVPKDIVKNYGEFCDVRKPSELTLTIDGQTVKGELVRAADGKIAKLSGRIRGDILTGQLADTNNFMSKFILTAKRSGNSISGSLAVTAWNSCTATFTITTDDPRYRKDGV